MKQVPIPKSSINPALLSQSNYFFSLINAASDAGLLTEADVSRLGESAIELLCARLRSYTGGESSSVRSELAEAVMSSLLYTVSLALRSFPTPEDAVRALQEHPFSELCKMGTERLKAKLFTVRQLGDFLKKTHKKTRAVYYKQAVTRAAHHFLSQYDPRFFADALPYLPDYPLAGPIKELLGVEYMQKYMESLYLETRFLLRFDDDTVEALLKAEDPSYAVTPLNLFRPVLLSALTATLFAKPPTDLFFAYHEKGLTSLFAGRTQNDIAILLTDALRKTMLALKEENRSLIAYAKAQIPALASLVYTAMKYDNFALAYKTLAADRTPSIRFRFGRRMDDDLYSGALYQIENAEEFDEKKALIHEKIHSLYDLEDVICDLPFSKEETVSLLSSLTESELAFLLKKHPMPDDAEKNYLSEGALRLATALSEILEKKTKAIQRTVFDLSLLISDDIFEL